MSSHSRISVGGPHLMLGIAGPQLSAEEAKLFRHLQPAGFILFSRNIVDAAQTRALTDQLRELVDEEPILAIDQEGGRVTRTTAIAPACPSAPEFVAADDFEGIARAAEATATLLRLLGLNLNFAPVLDLDHFPEIANALNGRSWGRDPQRVIDRAGLWNRIHRKRGMCSCGKHFPAGGRARTDPHCDLPRSDATIEQLLREDVIPFTALMPELDAVMVAHIEFSAIDAELPASLSPRVIRDFLRGQLGFDHHVVITDDLDMAAIRDRYGRGEAARLAIAAGNDLALICHDTGSALEAAEAIGGVPGALLDDSVKRLRRLRKRLKGPLKWRDADLETVRGKLAELRQRVSPLPSQAQDAAASPVNLY